MAIPKQIVSSQANRPVIGIVQDALLGSMLFTKRDTFVEKVRTILTCILFYCIIVTTKTRI